MKLRFLIFYLLILILQNQSFAQKAKAQDWIEDLHYLNSELKDDHKNLYHSVSEQDFQKAVDELEKKIPVLSYEEIIVELARIVAMVGAWTLPPTKATTGGRNSARRLNLPTRMPSSSARSGTTPASGSWEMNSIAQ